MVDGGIHEVGLVGEDARLKVAGTGALHAEACASEVGGADVGGLEVEDDDLEVDARAEDTFQSCEKDRIAVEVLPEVGAWLFGMDKAHFPAL